MTRFEFTKMHGLGNDFVIVDGRAGRPPSAAQIRAMSDRSSYVLKVHFHGADIGTVLLHVTTLAQSFI